MPAAHVGGVTSPPNLRSQPDLIADIYQQPKTQYPCKIEGLVQSKPALETSPGEIPPAVVIKDISFDALLANQKNPRVKYEQRVLSGQAKVLKAKLHRTGPSSRYNAGPGTGASECHTAKMVRQIQEQTNVSSLNYVRWMKCDVSKLREHLVKIEDEIKLANRAKTVLDGHVLDMRKSLSVNQQSISAQQQKTHKEVSIISFKLLFPPI